MDKLMLDGNAVAGLLQELFAADMTSAIGSCATCGATEPVGAIHVYRGAGIVLRCPHCDNTLAAIVRVIASCGPKPAQTTPVTSVLGGAWTT